MIAEYYNFFQNNVSFKASHKVAAYPTTFIITVGPDFIIIISLIILILRGSQHDDENGHHHYHDLGHHHHNHSHHPQDCADPFVGRMSRLEIGANAASLPVWRQSHTTCMCSALCTGHTKKDHQRWSYITVTLQQ